MSFERALRPSAVRSAQPTVRRLIVYSLLFILVVVSALGIRGLLARALNAADVLAMGDRTDLALWLAFTLVGGPLAAGLWWALWRRLRDDVERSATAWGLYVAGVYGVSLVVFVPALVRSASTLVEVGAGESLTGSLATGLVWGGVWLWHRWMWRHPTRGPVRLAGMPLVLGQVFGLTLGMGGAYAALDGIFRTALAELLGTTLVGAPWWRPVLQSLLWVLAGIALWWWHWVRAGGQELRTGLSSVALTVIGVMLPVMLALGGVGTTVYVLLRSFLDRTEPLVELLAPLAPAVAAGLVGLLVWPYHRAVASGFPPRTQEACRLVTAGIALAVAASGVGIVINSVLAVFVSSLTLAGGSPRSLLLGGISALVVGTPLWWAVWGPSRAGAPVPAAHAARRVYLVAVFGVSALIAVVTLLVIGFRVFEFLLGNSGAYLLVDRFRAPLGLLAATGLTAGYHFSVWSRDRSLLAVTAPERPSIGQVVLVSGQHAQALSTAIGAVTGAPVIVWTRADDVPEAEVEVPGEAAITAAFCGVAAPRVLVVDGQGSGLTIIPLQD